MGKIYIAAKGLYPKKGSKQKNKTDYGLKNTVKTACYKTMKGIQQRKNMLEKYLE